MGQKPERELGLESLGQEPSILKPCATTQEEINAIERCVRLEQSR